MHSLYPTMIHDTTHHAATASGLSSGVVVPQELVDTIIDNLFDDKEALRMCSLVSRLWLPSSRLHLFLYQCIIPHPTALEHRLTPTPHPRDETALPVSRMMRYSFLWGHIRICQS